MTSARPGVMAHAIGVLLALAACLPVHAGEADAAPQLAKIPYRMSCLVEAGRIPGAVVLVAKDGQLTHASAVGWQDMATRVPVSQDTRFRLYSMSKPIASVAVLQLVEQGKLRLDDPLDRFLPEFANLRVYASGDADTMTTVPATRQPTIRDLLTHTAGITYHFMSNPVAAYYRKHGIKRDTPVGRMPDDAPAATSLQQLAQRMGKAPLLHQPGERFSYSYSTTILGAVVERVSGKSLDRYLRDAIFAPLGMSETGFFVEGDDLQQFATNYQWDGQQLVEIENAGNTDYRDRARLLDGGGALAGTARDYLRFAQMLANGGALDGVRILKPETVQAMFRNQLPAGVASSGMGPGTFAFGFGVLVGNAESEQAQTTRTGAVGWDGSGNTFFWVDPAQHTVLVFMTQMLAGAKGPSAQLKPLVYQALYGGTSVAADPCAG